MTSQRESYEKHNIRILNSENKAEKESGKRPIRVWMDGSFDMLHLGHVAAMYEARAMGDRLIIGAQSDADVIQHKGPPVYPEGERFRLIQALKCVDEFVGAASYGTTIETLDKYHCDFCVHGADATLIASDTDVVKKLMEINRAKLVGRGAGPSTTIQIQRILQRLEAGKTRSGEVVERLKLKSDDIQSTQIHDTDDERVYWPTATQIHAFTNGRGPLPGEKIVYVDGAFDLFNVGHLSFLEKAAEQGDYLLVGVHSDHVVKCRKDVPFPILSVMERALLVLSLKCVSDVIFGAPASITPEFLEYFKIDLVCRGKISTKDYGDGTDPYCVPKKMGIFKIIDSGNDITSHTIKNRVLSKRTEYAARNKRKIQQEITASKRLRPEDN